MLPRFGCLYTFIGAGTYPFQLLRVLMHVRLSSHRNRGDLRSWAKLFMQALLADHDLHVCRDHIVIDQDFFQSGQSGVT